MGRSEAFKVAIEAVFLGDGVRIAVIGGDEFEPRDTIEKIITKYFELDRKGRIKSIHVSPSF